MKRHGRKRHTRNTRNYRRRAPKIGPNIRSILKVYKYKFMLKPQILINDVPNSWTVSTFGGSYPLTPANLSLNSSDNGLTGFFNLGIGARFQASDLANFSAFGAIYDAYRIDKVHMEIQFLDNTSAQDTFGLMPTMYIYWDQDDATVPVNIANIISKQGVRRFQFGNKMKTTFKYSFKPTIGYAVTTTNAGGITASQVGKSAWLNTTDKNVNFYGLKAMITDLYSPGATQADCAFRINWSYDISFRSPISTY